MPSQPPDNYERQFDFTDFSQTQPTKQQPGDKIDLELNELQQSVNDTISRLNEIQRDDGKLRDDIFDFTPMNNAVIEAQAARDQTYAKAAEVSAAKDFVVAASAGVLTSVNSTLTTAIAARDAAVVAKDGAEAASVQAQMFAGNAESSAEAAYQTSQNVGVYVGQASSAALEAAGFASQADYYRAQSLSSATNSAASATDASEYANLSLEYATQSADAINSLTFLSPLSKTGVEVSIDLSGYATEAWVGSQGFLTAPYNPFDQELNTGSSVTFLSAAVNDTLNVSNAIYMGTVGSLTQGTLTLSEGGPSMIVSHESITFPDYTVQTTAGIHRPAVAGVDGQILSTDGVNPVWIDNVARTLFSAVRNETGATLAKGTVVYINGASGNKATVAKAQANGDATSATTFAVLSADIANNNNGTAIVVGELAGLDTSAYAEGAALYLSPTVAGGFTTTKPHAPDHIVYVATVTRSHANQGIIEVRIQNGYELDELHNVQAQAPNDGDSIFYDSSDQQWKTGAPVTSAIVDAQRVDIQSFGSPTTSGSFTWTKPENAKFVEVYIFGAGGGGGSGARYATTSTRGGGGGGGGGSASVWKISASDLGSTVPVTVGAGGAGAPGALADNSTSAAASSGGDSIFGNYRAGGGTLGAIGTSTAGGGAGATKSSVIYYVSAVSGSGGSGTANNVVPSIPPASSLPLLARGGAGSPGAAANNTSQTNGATGGGIASTSTGGTGYNVTIAGGTGGTNASPNGGAGTASPILLGSGTGGGSGAYRPSAVGGAGGNGGWPSGGGGAGSASDNGFASGAGGSGANGRVVVITYF